MLKEYKKVSDYLQEVNYDFPDYTPTLPSLKFINFIKLVNKDRNGEEHNTPVVHYKILDTIFSKQKKSAIMCCRGLAKTTLCAEYLILYCAVFGSLDEFGSINLILYVGDSMENGAKNLRKNVEFRYENSEFLKSQISKASFTDSRLEFVNNKGNILVIKLYGAKTGVRGSKEQGIRPQLAILDDLLSDEDARSTTILSSIEDTVHKAVSKALHPTRSKTIWLGTPFNQRDPLYKAVESGAWNVSVYPVCEEFTKDTTKETFKGAWADRFTYEYVKEQFDSALLEGKIDAFNQELMLNIVSSDSRLIKEGDINYFNKDLLLKNKHKYNFYITTDFATSVKSSADYSVISVWALGSNQDIFYVAGKIERCSMDKNIDDLFNYVRIYKPLEVGIEITGQQQGFISWIQKEMITRNIFFRLSKQKDQIGIRPTTDKLTRFNTILPVFKKGNFWLSEEIKHLPLGKEILNELNNITASGFKSSKDDWIDTLSMLTEIRLIFPMANEPTEEEVQSILCKQEFDTIFPEDNYKVSSNSYIM